MHPQSIQRSRKARGMRPSLSLRSCLLVFRYRTQKCVKRGFWDRLRAARNSELFRIVIYTFINHVIDTEYREYYNNFKFQDFRCQVWASEESKDHQQTVQHHNGCQMYGKAPYGRFRQVAVARVHLVGETLVLHEGEGGTLIHVYVPSFLKV